MGYEIAPRSKQCGTTAKTSEWERAGHDPGGPGGLPPALFLPISREKWGPRRAGGPPGALRPEASEKPRPPKGYAVPPRPPPGTGRETTSQGPPCDGPSPDHPPGGKTAPLPPFPSGNPPQTVVQWYQQNQNRRRWLWQRSSCWHWIWTEPSSTGRSRSPPAPGRPWTGYGSRGCWWCPSPGGPPRGSPGRCWTCRGCGTR